MELKLILSFVIFFGSIILLIGIQKVNDSNSNIKQTGYAPLLVGLIMILGSLFLIIEKYYI